MQCINMHGGGDRINLVRSNNTVQNSCIPPYVLLWNLPRAAAV